MIEFFIMTALTACWAGLEICAFLFFIKAFLPIPQKICSKKFFVCILLNLWLVMSFYPNFINNKWLKILISLFLWVAVSRILFCEKLVSIVCLVSVFYIFSGIIDLIMTYGVPLIMGIGLQEFVYRKFTYTTVITLGKLFFVFVAWLLYHFRRVRKLQDIQKKYFLLILLFPVISGIILTFLFYGSRNEPDLSAVSIFIGILLALANIGVIYIINTIDDATQQMKETALLKQKIQLQAESYDALQRAYAFQRKSTHEFEHHLVTLRSLMEQHEYVEATDYIQRLQADRSLKVFSIHTHHPVIDVILNQKYQLAQDLGIEMQVRVNDLSDVTIPPNSLVVLLSNLLDNAIEACSQVSKAKEIDCCILMDEAIFLSVRNSSVPVKITESEIESTKENRLEHGYGMQAITFILKELNAEYGFNYSDGWFQFAAEIPQ